MIPTAHVHIHITPQINQSGHITPPAVYKMIFFNAFTVTIIAFNPFALPQATVRSLSEKWLQIFWR